MSAGRGLRIPASGKIAVPSGVATNVTPLGSGASASWLSGARLFLQHGPINLIVHASGEPDAVDAGYQRLCAHFPIWLGGLVGELARLRSPEAQCLPLPEGPIARRMARAVEGCSSDFVTPMAAVAGAVADEAVAILAAQAGVERAYVNNGGDIALHLSAGRTLAIGIVPSLAQAMTRATINIDSNSTIRGIATSGWQGRSHSLGIADSVTVLASNAARADAAATLIANAVNLDHPEVLRVPAWELDEDSDLGDRLVTVAVPELAPRAIATALDAGLAAARSLHERGVIEAAALCLQGHWRAQCFPGAPAAIELPVRSRA